MLRVSGTLLASTLLVAACSASLASPALTQAVVRSRVRAATLGGLVGDALALAFHYEYDASVIASSSPHRQTEFLAPKVNYGVGWGRANYHPGKVAGDMTDAGDVALMLLEHVSATRAYDFDAFERHWRESILPPSGAPGYGSCNFQSVGRDFQGPCPPHLKAGYLNGATRRTLEVLAHAPGQRGEARKQQAAVVNCLFAATHFAPLLALPYADEAAFVADATSTVYLSHNHNEPTEAAAFLARAAYRLVHRTAASADGADAAHHRQTLEAVLTASSAATGSQFIAARLADALAKVAEALNPATALHAHGALADDVAITSMARLWDVGRTEPIKVGKASPTEGALPAALYFSLKYADAGLEEALIANAACGGDSGARAVVIGTLLGALHGETALPQRWLDTLREFKRADAMLNALLSISVADAESAKTEL